LLRLLPLLVASSLVMHITLGMPLLFSLSFFFGFVKQKKRKKKEKKIKEFLKRR